MRLGGTPEIYIAGDTRQTPIVLTLEHRTRSEAVYAHCNIVDTGMQLVCHIELRCQVAVFGIPDKLTVYPHVIAMSGTIETEKDIASLPIFGQGELPTV